VDVVRITQTGGRQVDTPDFTSRISPACQMSPAFNARDVNRKGYEMRLQQKAPTAACVSADR